MKIDIVPPQLRNLLDVGAADIEFKLGVSYKDDTGEYVRTVIHNNITITDASAIESADNPIWDKVTEHIVKELAKTVAAEIRKANKR